MPWKKPVHDPQESGGSSDVQENISVSNSVVGLLNPSSTALANLAFDAHIRRSKQKKLGVSDIFAANERAVLDGEFIPIKAGGGAAGQNCMRTRYVAACPTKKFDPGNHDSLAVHNSCGRVTCPTCKKKAIGQQVSASMERIEAYQELHEDAWGKRLKVSHVSFTFPARMFTKTRVKKEGTAPIWKEVERLWKKHNLHPEGGAEVMIHLTKQLHVDDDTPCHERRCEREHYDKWAPHVHFLGFLYFTRSDVIRAEDHVAVWKHPDEWGYRDVAATLAYELGHAWTVVQKGDRWLGVDYKLHDAPEPQKVKPSRCKEMIHHYGVLSKRKLKRKAVGTETNRLKCQCEEDMAKYRPIEDTDNPDYDRQVSWCVELSKPVYEYRVDHFPDRFYRTGKVLERKVFRIKAPPDGNNGRWEGNT